MTLSNLPLQGFLFIMLIRNMKGSGEPGESMLKMDKSMSAKKESGLVLLLESS